MQNFFNIFFDIVVRADLNTRCYEHFLF